MIKEIQLDNIQGHTDTYLELSEKVNVVKGTSSNGKSSIIRGFKWFLTNKLPRKGEIKNWDASEKDGCSFSVGTSEGIDISRVRTKDFNGYVIIKDDEELTFEATGTEVPDEVKQVLRMEECNLLSQEDGYHFLTDSPGEVARKLNKRLGLSIIDEKKKKATNLVKEYRSDLKIASAALLSNRERIKSLSWLKSANVLLEEVNSLEKEMWEDDKAITDMVLAETDIQNLQERIEEVSYILRLKPDVEECLQLNSEIEAMDTKLDSMVDSFNSMVEASESIEEAEILIEFKSDIEDALKVHQELADLNSYIDKMKNACQSMHKIKSTLKIEMKQLDELIAQKDTILSEIKECPHCGSSKEHWTKEIE